MSAIPMSNGGGAISPMIITVQERDTYCTVRFNSSDELPYTKVKLLEYTGNYISQYVYNGTYTDMTIGQEFTVEFPFFLYVRPYTNGYSKFMFY